MHREQVFIGIMDIDSLLEVDEGEGVPRFDILYRKTCMKAMVSDIRHWHSLRSQAVAALLG